MERNVEFKANDGTVIRGKIYWTGSKPATGIVMAHGFGGMRAMIDHYADYFSQAGFAVLVHDHRGFGESDGLRHDINPYQQLSDWKDAITFFEGQPEVDASQGMGIWGSSFAGGLAMVMAANDPRIACVVAQIPNVSGHRNTARMFTPPQLEDLHARIAADRKARLGGAKPGMYPLFPEEPGQYAAYLYGVPDSFADQMRTIPPEVWKNEVTLSSMEHLLEFEPAAWGPYVAPKPLLMVVGEKDVCTFIDIQLAVFAELREPKKLVTYAGGHFDAYGEFFNETAGPAREWFCAHLNAGSATPAA